MGDYVVFNESRGKQNGGKARFTCRNITRIHWQIPFCNKVKAYLINYINLWNSFLSEDGLFN